MTEHRISATEARRHFGKVLRQVTETDAVSIVEFRGVPKVAILSRANDERMKARADAREAAAAATRGAAGASDAGEPVAQAADLEA